MGSNRPSMRLTEIGENGSIGHKLPTMIKFIPLALRDVDSQKIFILGRQDIIIIDDLSISKMLSLRQDFSEYQFLPLFFVM